MCVICSIVIPTKVTTLLGPSPTVTTIDQLVKAQLGDDLVDLHGDDEAQMRGVHWGVERGAVPVGTEGRRGGEQKINMMIF